MSESESHLPARPGPLSADGAATLDDVLRARRSIRRFTADVPSRVAVEAILEAGRLAPYGALALPSLADCRRFIVVARGTPSWAEAERLMNAQVKRFARRVRWATRLIPSMRRRWQVFARRMETFAAQGFPVFETAPFIVFVAERRGHPPVQKQSLAHVMENMWLQATALGLGFQLFSTAQIMTTHREFMAMLGLESGAWDLDACAFGYPAQQPGKRELPSLSELVRWLG